MICCTARPRSRPAALKSGDTGSSVPSAALSPGQPYSVMLRMRSKFPFEEHVVHVCAAPNGRDTYREVWPLRWSGGLSARNQAGALHVCVGNGNHYPPATAG
jgi:hypothetical protein